MFLAQADVAHAIRNTTGRYGLITQCLPFGLVFTLNAVLWHRQQAGRVLSLENCGHTRALESNLRFSFDVLDT